MLLPLIGAGLGAYQGYQEGGLGGAALGAGLGAATPLGLRMAGTALGAGLAGRGLASGAANVIGMGAKQARLANMPQIAAGLRQGAGAVRGLTPAALGGLAAGVGTLGLGVPALAGGLGTKAAKAVLPKAGEAVGVQRTVQGVIDPATGDFIPLETEAAPGMPRGPRTAAEMLNPAGYEMGSLELQRRLQDVGLEGAGKFMNLERSYLDEAKTRDLARSAAAARLATDLATQQGLTLGGQRIAGAMSTQALGDVGAGLRTQYRYL